MKGLTIWYVLASMVVLGVLAAILWPVRSIHPKPRSNSACISNLRFIGSAMHLYIADYDGAWPPGRDAYAALTSGSSIHDLLYPYLRVPSLWSCQNDRGRSVDEVGLKPVPATDSCYDSYGSSYRYRDDLTIEDQLLEEGWSEVAIFADYSGQWHAKGRGLAPLKPEMGEDAMYRLVSDYRYNVLFGDTRAKSVRRETFITSWMRRPEALTGE